MQIGDHKGEIEIDRVVIDDGDHFRPARAQGACRRIFDVIETFGDELYLSSGGFGDIVRAAQGVRNRLRTDARRARYIFHRHSFRHLFFLAYSLRPLPNAVSLRPFSFAPDAVPALRRVSSPRPPHSPVRPVPPSRFPSPRKTEAAPPAAEPLPKKSRSKRRKAAGAEKFQKGRPPSFVALKYRRVVEDALAHPFHPFRHRFVRGLFRKPVAVFPQQRGNHVLVNGHILRDFFVFPRQKLFRFLQLVLQPPGQNKHAHRLDQADRFALDIMIFLVRVENAVGLFLVAAVVSQQEIEEIAVGRLSCDR